MLVFHLRPLIIKQHYSIYILLSWLLVWFKKACRSCRADSVATIGCSVQEHELTTSYVNKSLIYVGNRNKGVITQLWSSKKWDWIAGHFHKSVACCYFQINNFIAFDNVRFDKPGCFRNRSHQWFKMIIKSLWVFASGWERGKVGIWEILCFLVKS